MVKKEERFGWLEFPEKEREILEPEEGKDAFYYLQVAEKNYYEGYYETALRNYARALKCDKMIIDAWAGQVKSLLCLEELEEAEVWINNALGYFPKAADLLAVKAVVLCELGRMEESLPYSDSSLEYTSRSGYPWIARGNVLLFLRRKKVADKCLEKIISESSKDWRICFEISKVYFRHKDFTMALYFLDKAISENPGNAFLWLQMARCYQALRLKNKVKFCCEKALQTRKTFPEAQELLNSCGGKFCFIATICFQDPKAKELLILKRWRDNFLENHLLGRTFLNIYYQTGPSLAKIISKSRFLCGFTRFFLKLIIFFIRDGN